MHPTAAFTAPFGFVGWTIPSPRWVTPGGRLPSSLYTFPGGLGSGLPVAQGGYGFPEFGRFHLELAPQAALLIESCHRV